MIRKQEHSILIRVDAFPGEHLVLRGLILALSVCIAGYLYFVGLSIMNVIANREASVESDRLRSIVGQLEQDYFELTKSITPDMAPALGLEPAKRASYVRSESGVASNVQNTGI